MRLASKLRPKKLEDVYGNKELLTTIKAFLDKEFLPSMILYGPSGTGKTTIARIIAKHSGKVIFLNAAVDKIKAFQDAIAAADNYDKLILIVDEIHRLNKDKQDILLPHIEDSNIILIGMTTANPLYSVNPALRSRCSLFELKKLSEEDIIKALSSKKIKDVLPGIKIDKDTIKYIASLSGGDLRYAYNNLETAYYAGANKVSLEILKKLGALPALSGDSDADEHFNLLSAFQKSIRGSHTDAALHYLARLLAIGDLASINRRLIVISYEDIGLANINAQRVVKDAVEAAEKIGMPEARLILAVAVIYLTTSPKSNSAHNAINKAYSDVLKGATPDIPANITDAAPGYLYPHDFPKRVVKQKYLPDGLEKVKYYEPVDIGDEKIILKIKKELDKILE